jgi:4'-phosphopantetheinyl transferase
MENEQTLFSNQRMIEWESICLTDNDGIRKQFEIGCDVHVWQVSLTAFTNSGAHLYEILSREEKNKTRNYRFARDQSRYIISHGILRYILAAYVEDWPSSLKFNRNRFGKPHLITQTEGERVRFNMSHSKDMVSFIISGKHEVGIDLEFIDYDFDWHIMAKQYFSPQEMGWLELLPLQDRVNAFYFLWTRKEALLKLLGIGLTGIDQFGDQALSDLLNKHTLVSLQLEGNYQCSLAVNPGTSGFRYYVYC